VRALITTRRSGSDRNATDSLLKSLLDSEQLHVSDRPRSGPPTFQGSIEADVGSGVLRVQGMARMLHITGGIRS
jgi:hypothetical protein